MASLADVSAEDLAYSNLRYFSEFCWGDMSGQVPNGEFQNEWYEMLQGDDRPRRLHIQAAREHAKTTCLSVKYPLWRVGRNPDLRVMIVSQSATLANTIVREIRMNIENNMRLRSVFPALREPLGKVSRPWSNSELQVKRTPGIILKDATFVGIGLGGSLTGKRADLIIVDDPFDENEVRTEAQRKKVEDWIDKMVLPTLTPQGEIVFVGTPWHYADYWANLDAKRIEKGGNYVVKKYPAIKNPEDSVEKWDVQWPEVWTPERLSERRYEMGSVKFNCLYLLDPSGLEGTLFKRDWLTYFDPTILTEGYIRDFEYYMGVDPNVSANIESDRLGIVTIAYDRKKGDIYVLDVYAEPTDFPTQMKKIVELTKRRQLPYISKMKDVHIRKVGIEANAWQQVVSKTAYANLLPVIEVKQKQTKHDRMVALQPHFENGRFKFPDPRFGVNWWDKFESEYLAYPKGRYRDVMDALQIAFEMVGESKKDSSMKNWVREERFKTSFR